MLRLQRSLAMSLIPTPAILNLCHKGEILLLNKEVGSRKRREGFVAKRLCTAPLKHAQRHVLVVLVKICEAKSLLKRVRAHIKTQPASLR